MTQRNHLKAILKKSYVLRTDLKTPEVISEENNSRVLVHSE